MTISRIGHMIGAAGRGGPPGLSPVLPPPAAAAAAAAATAASPPPHGHADRSFPRTAPPSRPATALQLELFNVGS